MKATLTEGLTLDARRDIDRAWFRAAALDGLSKVVLARLRHRLLRQLPSEVVRLAVEPPVEKLIQLAQPYVGARTNHLILLSAAKIVDFLLRGASGVINASGINCIVGVAAASVPPPFEPISRRRRLSRWFAERKESPVQRIRLETLVHQVHERPRPAAA